MVHESVGNRMAVTFQLRSQKHGIRLILSCMFAARTPIQFISIATAVLSCRYIASLVDRPDMLFLHSINAQIHNENVPDSYVMAPQSSNLRKPNASEY